MMSQPEHHEMQIMEKYPSGTEVWYCPVCGRKFLLDWPPAYKKTILEVGDEAAIHNGGKGGLSISPPEINEEKEPILPETIRVTVERILKKFDLDDPQDDSVHDNK